MKRVIIGITTILIFILCMLLYACTKESPEGVDKMHHYIENLEKFPVSFEYEGKEYKGLKEGFGEKSRISTKKDKEVRNVIILEHNDSKATFTVEFVSYPEYDAFEWTISIENSTESNTGVFKNFNAADMTFEGENPILKGLSGDAPSFYVPYETKLTGEKLSFGTQGGRPTHGGFPYYNLEYGKGGVLIAIGWPGNWQAHFQNEDGNTHFTGGLKDFETYLTPGEKVRMPLMAFVLYDSRDNHTATNVWRNWFIDCNMPRVDGAEIAPALAAGNMADGYTTSRHIMSINAYKKNGINIDYYWLDAGWYTGANGETVSWPKTGTLQIDTKRYPDKFKDISETLANNGAELLLWFEPEVIRVDREAFLKSNPDFSEEWLLGRVMQGTWLEGELVDLGNPDCVKWLSDRICTIIEEGNVAIYRQDFNVDPATAWTANDTENRIGITENKYCQGYLAFWDGLRERFPNLIIDSCASGGGRNDLESMRRAIPLHITDLFDGNDNQYATKNGLLQAVFAWFPYFKAEFKCSNYKYVSS